MKYCTSSGGSMPFLLEMQQLCNATLP